MVKKVYGLNEKGEQIELDFKKFLIITDNDSNLEINLDVKKHPEEPDFALYIDHGPLAEIAGDQEVCKKFEPTEGRRYFSFLPGACNLVYVRAVRRKQS